MNRAVEGVGGQAGSGVAEPDDVILGGELGTSSRLTARPPDRLCNRCGFVVPRPRARGCKNPCPNCGTVYPLGDCSD